MAEATTRDFQFGGHRLVYDEYGAGERAILLLPGLLFSRKMHAPLASTLAERGYRVLCLDLLGHGDSDRPEEMWNYSMPQFGEQAVALLEELEIDEAVVGGTSLGANATLEVAAQAPKRLRGMVIEMPVLDNALLACAVGFTPLLVGLTFGAPAARLLGLAARQVPRGLWALGDSLLDWVSQDPKPSASVLQGLFFGRTAPPRSERMGFETRALVIGHPRDPIHPFSDSDMLMGELRDSHLLEASSILELRLTPDRLTDEIASFVDGCWEEPAGRAQAKRSRTSATRRGGAEGHSGDGRDASGRSRRRPV